MKRIALVIGIFLVVGATATLGADTFVVGVEQSTKDSWQALGTQFQEMTGIAVSVQPLAQNSIAQQITLQAFTKSGRLNFVMVSSSWASSIARYLQDLSNYAPTLSAQGITPISVSGRVVGVPIAFAQGWFLGVLTWPQNVDGAVDFLVAAALGASTSGSPTPTELAMTFTRGKIERSLHSPKFDGALESLIAAAQSTGAAMSAAGGLPSAALVALDTIASVYGVPFSEQAGTVTVIMETSPGRSAQSNVSALATLGISGASVEASSSLIKVTVPVSQLTTVMSQLTGVAYVRAPYQPYTLGYTSEGRAAIGADAYASAGATGTGVKVAVIDLGFYGLSQAQARGDLPMSVVQNDFTGTGLTSGISHGTAVAEIIYDIAPGAELTLIKIGDEVDLDQAVTYCLANSIDIINHSLGWYNTSNYDGTGTIADIARRATSGGILWINAVGNEAESHWRGAFVDANSDGWGDTSVTFSASAGSPIVIYLTWNEWPAASTDYDLYLYDPSSNLLASSAKYQTGTEEPTESIQTTATLSGTYTLRFRGSGSRTLNLFNLYQSVSPSVAASSLLSPADVAEVVAVGAIHFANYATGPQEPYSSQGPTTDGRTKPDLACPDYVTTGTAPYTAFAGTSGAAPHAAGAAALLLSLQPSLSGSALRSQLLTHVVSMGSPNIYGLGRLVLQPLAPTNQPPTASFTAMPASAVVGQTVAFNGAASSDVDGSIVSWVWSFGDGFSGSGPSTSHAYSVAGTYTATLTVQDDDGATGTTTRTVTITAAPNQAPTASFTVSPSTAMVGQSVSFNASASSDVDGAIVAYGWAFGDGATAAGIASSHAYAAAGTYTAVLTVQDDDGATGTTTRTVTITATPNQAPTASFTATPSPALVGQVVTFNAGASTDPDGYITYFGWAFGDGSTATGTSTSHAYAAAGTYTATLTVQDDDGATGTTTRQVIVQAPAYPDLAIQSFTYSPISPTVGSTITFTVVVANQGSASAGSFRVRLNGSSLSTTATSSSISAGGSRTLTLSLPLTTGAETYTVLVDDLSQVTESNEGNNSQSVVIVAVTPAPVAHAGGPYAGVVGTPVSFSGATSTGSITTYSWSFGDGGSASGASVAHAYAAAGTYTVVLTVSGPGGTSVDATQAVITTPQPALTASISLPKAVYTVGETITMTVTVNRPAYVYVCEVTADNRVVLLFPSLYEPNNLVSAGSRAIPGGAYTLVASLPAGAESLLLFAATGPISGFPTSFGSGFPTLSTNPPYFQASVLAAMQASYSASNRASSSVAFTILAAAPTTGTLRVRSTPTGATVRVNGSAVGSTNLELTSVTPGTYTVEISRSGYQTVTQSATVTAGATTTVQVTLTALPANQAPVAAFAYTPPAPNAGTLVQFDATSSSDPDGTIVSYAWNFGDGGTAVGASPTHTYAATGSYTVQLTVTDNGGRTGQVSRTVGVVLSDDVGWVSPTSFEDPSNKWSSEERAYDNDLGLSAFSTVDTGQWSTYLLLTLPGTGVVSDRVRLYVSDSSPNTTHFFTWSVEAFVDGAWVQVYSAKPTVEKQWFEVSFTQGTVTQLRLRAHNDTGGMWRVYLTEIDVHDSTVGP